MKVTWSPEEHERLVGFCKTDAPVSTYASHFPGRTENAIYSYMKKQGIVKPRRVGRDAARAAQIEALIAERPMTAADVAGKLSVTLPAVRPFLNELHRQKRIHIAERVLLGPTVRTLLWAIGDKPDAPMLTKSCARPSKPKAAKARKVVSLVQVRRDPFQEVFFGRPAVCLERATNIPTRVFQQSMEVVEDELEVAA